MAKLSKTWQCAFKESQLLIKWVSETSRNQAKEQKRAFLGMLLGTLAAYALENMLTGRRVITAGEGTIRAGQDF